MRREKAARDSAPRRPKAASRVEYSAGNLSVYRTAKLATFWEIHHMPRKGITSKEIADRYDLGEIWYEYEGSDRRVNMAEQLVRNELNRWFKKRMVVKMWNERTGKYIMRGGYVVYFKPDQIPMKQVEYGQHVLPNGKWFRD